MIEPRGSRRGIVSERSAPGWLLGALGLGIAAMAAILYGIHRSTYLSFPTRFGRARIYQVEDDDGSPVRLLEVNGIVQSGTYLDDRYTDLVFTYLRTYDLAFEAERPLNRVCVLGCGGYDYPEHLIASHPQLIVDAVEIDPSITALAARYFFLDRLIEAYDLDASGRLNLIEADALDFLSGTAQGHPRTTPSLKVEGPKTTADAERELPGYDAIFNDVFDGAVAPSHLTTRDFLEAVHRRLNPGGLYLSNIVAPLIGPGSDFLYGQIALAETVFKNVYIFPCDRGSLEEPDNVILVATEEPLPRNLAANSL